MSTSNIIEQITDHINKIIPAYINDLPDILHRHLIVNEMSKLGCQLIYAIQYGNNETNTLENILLRFFIDIHDHIDIHENDDWSKCATALREVTCQLESYLNGLCFCINLIKPPKE